MTVTENGTIWITRRYRTQLEDREELNTDELEVRIFETDPARVRQVRRRTINLGNYESVSIEVGVELPCYVEEIDDASDEASYFVEERMDELVAAVTPTAGKPRRSVSKDTVHPF